MGRPHYYAAMKTLQSPKLPHQDELSPIYVETAAASLSVGTVAAYGSTGDSNLDYIIAHESGGCAFKWQGEVGACPAYHGVPSDPAVGYGLCQSTPANKMASAGADWATNPATQVAWCTSYALARYGSTYAAYLHWVANHNW